MTPWLVVGFVIAAVAVAIPLAVLINRVDRWWRFERFIRQIVAAPKRSARSPCDPVVLSPHARPPNVRALSSSHRKQKRTVA